MKKKNQRIPVLIIDDEQTWCKLAEYNLYLDGFEVYITPDGPSGIKSAIENHPRLVLLDITLPNMDGFEVLSTLKRDSRTSNIPVIMLSAKNAVEDIEQAFGLGADDYITKPSKPSDLGKIIKAKMAEWEKAVRKKNNIKRIPVLVIDDDICWRKVVEHNLYLFGFEIYTAANGPDGIEAALKHKPRLILLDVMMPEMDGLQVLSTLKHDPRTSHIPVIMLTAKGAVGDIDRAFEIGADDYITKPFEGRILGKTIKEKVQKLRKPSILPWR